MRAGGRASRRDSDRRGPPTWTSGGPGSTCAFLAGFDRVTASPAEVNGATGRLFLDREGKRVGDVRANRCDSGHERRGAAGWPPPA